MSTKNKGEHNFSLQAFGHRASVYAIGNITVLASPFLLIPLYTHFMPRTEYGLLATLLLSGNFLTLLLIAFNGMALVLLRLIAYLSVKRGS